MTAWLRTRQKYGSRRVEAYGYSFASKLEHAVFCLLKLREKAQEIRIVKVQDRVLLSEAEIDYRPDFLIEDLKTGELVNVESKGYAAPTWPLKLKLWRAYGPRKLEIWDGSYVKPRLKEIVEASVRKTCPYCGKAVA